MWYWRRTIPSSLFPPSLYESGTGEGLKSDPLSFSFSWFSTSIPETFRTNRGFLGIQGRGTKLSLTIWSPPTTHQPRLSCVLLTRPSKSEQWGGQIRQVPWAQCHLTSKQVVAGCTKEVLLMGIRKKGGEENTEGLIRGSKRVILPGPHTPGKLPV